MSLFDLIREAEGAEPEIYVDSAGIPTIGAGFNLKVGSVRNAVLNYFGFSQLERNDLLSLGGFLADIFDRDWANATDEQQAQWRADADNALAAAAENLPGGAIKSHP